MTFSLLRINNSQVVNCLQVLASKMAKNDNYHGPLMKVDFFVSKCK